MAIKLDDIKFKDPGKGSLLDVIINRPGHQRRQHKKRAQNNRPTRPWETKVDQFQKEEIRFQQSKRHQLQSPEQQDEIMAKKIQSRAQKLFGPFKDLFKF